MKMTRKLIPALVMLLVSAIMLSTASFAWFASNDVVTATDMSVTAKSAARFLEISNAEGGTYTASAEATNDAKEVDLIHAKVNGTTVSWYTGSSTLAGDKGTTNSTPIDGGIAEDGGSYALVNTFYVKMSAGSTIDLTNLTVTKVTVAGTTSALDPALRVLVVGENGAQIYRPTADGSLDAVTIEGSANSATLINTIPKEGPVKTIKVYVYFDGDDAAATTNNAATLVAKTVSVEFTAYPAAQG